MAVSYKKTGVVSGFCLQCVDVTDIEEAGLNDIMPGATTIYSVDIDNIGSGVAYVRLFDEKSPTYGTTDPSVMIRVSATTRNVWTIAQGLQMTNGLSLMASQADGADATTAPAGSGTNMSIVCT